MRIGALTIALCAIVYQGCGADERGPVVVRAPGWKGVGSEREGHPLPLVTDAMKAELVLFDLLDPDRIDEVLGGSPRRSTLDWLAEETRGYRAVDSWMKQAVKRPVALPWPSRPQDQVGPTTVLSLGTYRLLARARPETALSRSRSMLRLAELFVVRRATDFNLKWALVSEACAILHDFASAGGTGETGELRSMATTLENLSHTALDDTVSLLQSNSIALAELNNQSVLWPDELIDAARRIDEASVELRCEVAPQELGWDGFPLSRAFDATAVGQRRAHHVRESIRATGELVKVLLADGVASAIRFSRGRLSASGWVARLLYRTAWNMRIARIASAAMSVSADIVAGSESQPTPIVSDPLSGVPFEIHDHVKWVQVEAVDSPWEEHCAVRDKGPMSWRLYR